MQRSETADLVKQLRDALFLVDIDPECRDYAAKNQCVEAAIAAADQWLAEQPTNQCGETCERTTLARKQ